MTEKNTNDQYVIKICTIGTPTELIKTFLTHFTPQHHTLEYLSTIGFETYGRIIEIDKQEIKLHIMNVAWHTPFQRLRSLYFEGAMGLVIFFTKSDRNSLKLVQKWVVEFKKGIRKEKPIILMGLSTNSDEEVFFTEGEGIAEKYQLKYLEYSFPKTVFKPKTDLFIYLANLIISQVMKHE